MKTILTSLLFTSIFTSVFAASPVDPNMPRAGLYKWEMKAVSQHDQDTTIKSKVNETGATTRKVESNGKSSTQQYAGDGTTKEVCIDYSKTGGDAQKMMANCKARKPVRNGNTTTASSVCNGIKTVVHHTKINDNVYETKSEIEMSYAKHKSHTVMTRVGDCKL